MFTYVNFTTISDFNGLAVFEFRCMYRWLFIFVNRRRYKCAPIFLNQSVLGPRLKFMFVHRHTGIPGGDIVLGFVHPLIGWFHPNPIIVLLYARPSIGQPIAANFVHDGAFLAATLHLKQAHRLGITYRFPDERS